MIHLEVNVSLKICTLVFDPNPDVETLLLKLNIKMRNY